MHRLYYVKAEILLKQALAILETKKHADAYRCYEYLGDIYAAQREMEKAQEAYYQAFKLVHKNFPKNSVHILRLTKKIKFRQRLFFWVCSFFSNLSIEKGIQIKNESGAVSVSNLEKIDENTSTF